MKKIIMLLLCTAALIFTILFLQIPQKKPSNEQLLSSSKSTSFYFSSNAAVSQESSSAVQTGTKQSESYTVKEYRGHLAVFRDEETVPFLEYETDVDLLPEKDQEMLKTGRTVHTMAEVEKIVEDYDS